MTEMYLRLYSAAGANCCDRVRWLLHYKAVPFELIDIGCSDEQTEFRMHSPFGRVPLLLIDGMPLSESMAIAEFIEEIEPRPNLLGASPYLRALVREICEAVNSTIHPVQNSSTVRYFHPSWSKEQMRPLRASWIAENLLQLDSRLWSSSQYAVGENFSLADIFVGVMYRKAIALGSTPDLLPAFEHHWSFLMSNPEVRRSSPYWRSTHDA